MCICMYVYSVQCISVCMYVCTYVCIIINNYMHQWIFSKIKYFFKRKKIKLNRVLIFGVAYKKNIDDDRESPSYHFMKILKKIKYFFDYYILYFLI